MKFWKPITAALALVILGFIGYQLYEGRQEADEHARQQLGMDALRSFSR